MRRGKNYKKAQECFEQIKAYSVDEALEILSKFPKTKFDESVEVHVRLNLDSKKSDQQVRGTVNLPHGTGKTLRIAAFTETQVTEAKKAGADLVGGEELIEKISNGKVDDFEVAVATPEMMPKLAKVAKILGPKGLMPNPKSETVGLKITPMIEGLKKGKASFKNDNGGNIHQVVGKRSFDVGQLKENTEAFLKSIRKMKPTAVKGKLIKKVTVTATMSPSITVKA
ncbi:MAG: 50S ribosomal protein L1 [Patescibacteria group bacterium]|nr:50S ribosomal protein L1 [Patescibacteria group bacterium]